MPPVVYTFGFLLLVLTRKVESVSFQQSSPQVVKEGTVELTINCSHDDSSLTNMLWYQQKQSSRSMSFIGNESAAKKQAGEKVFVTGSAVSRGRRWRRGGKVESVSFQQSSPQVVKEGTVELTINCSHDGSSLSTMLWYQQKQSSRSMSLIGFVVLQNDPVYEDQFKNSRFKIKGEGIGKGSLIIQTVTSSDSAVYFCAASTQ
ncbi:hypothetical protein ABVT39_016692 [Epinephelus coioides]